MPSSFRLVFFCLNLLAASPAGAAEYFVATDGSDAAPGTRAAPWKTVTRAFSKLREGDTLNLRSATYYESGLRLGARGAPELPIVIQTDPADLQAGKERATIDAGRAEYERAPNDQWEKAPKFNAAAPVYRTREKFPGATRVSAWLLGQSTFGATIPREIQLFTYDIMANVGTTLYVPTMTDKTEQPLYIGPGVHLGEDEHIYIRLTINPHDAVDEQRRLIAEAPYTNTDFNPNHYRIALAAVKEDRPRTKGETYSFTPALITLDGAAHVRFANLEFAHAYAVMRWNGAGSGEPCHDIEVDRCKIVHGESGILAYGARDCRIVNSEFDGATPDWLHWRDVKDSAPIWKEAFPEFQSFAINGVLTGFVVANNLVHQTMDGLLLRNRTVGAKILRNVICDTHDDAINLDPNVKDVEIGWNVMRHCHAGMSLILPFGISSTTDEVIPETKGSAYIHHNVIDLSKFHRYARESEGTVWSTGSHFASHGHDVIDVPWKIYNNTIIGRSPQHKKADLGLGGRQIQTSEVYVYNNLFYSIDDRTLLAGVKKTTGAHYDGNAYRRASADRAPLFANFSDGGTYSTLQDFLRKQAKSDQLPRWETNAIEIVEDARGGTKPMFDETAIRAPSYEAAQLWDLYRPRHHAEMFITSVRPPEEWPAASSAGYRGAVGLGEMPKVGPQ